MILCGTAIVKKTSYSDTNIHINIHVNATYLSDASVATHHEVSFNSLYKSKWIDFDRTTMPLL